MNYRDFMRQKFFDILAKTSFEVASEEEALKLEEKLNGEYLIQLLKLTVDLEQALFKGYKDNKEYAKKARSIVFNLDNKKNPSLKMGLIIGSIPATFMINATAEDFLSEQQKQDRLRIAQEDMISRRTDWDFEQ